MPWESSDRKSRLPADWGRLVAAVRSRACTPLWPTTGQCEALLPRSGRRCPREGRDCDHVIPNDDHKLRNLRWLCTHHHALKSAAEGHAARRGYRKPSKLRRERHPGER